MFDERREHLSNMKNRYLTRCLCITLVSGMIFTTTPAVFAAETAELSSESDFSDQPEDDFISIPGDPELTPDEPTPTPGEPDISPAPTPTPGEPDVTPTPGEPSVTPTPGEPSVTPTPGNQVSLLRRRFRKRSVCLSIKLTRWPLKRSHLIIKKQ